MNRHVIYLLVRNDPYSFGELTGMLRRQSRVDFDLVALVEGIPDGKLKTLLDQRTRDRLTVDETTLARTLTDDIARRAPATVTLLDTGYLPSNTVWFERLVAPLEEGKTGVALSRLVHDLYTNWLVQNDFAALQHRADGETVPPLLFPFGAVAFTPPTLTRWPLPGAARDDILLRWGMSGPAPATLVHDALLTHLHPLTPADLIGAHRRLARSAWGPMGRIGYAFSQLTGGLARDASFAFSRRRPRWLFYSCYFRFRIAFGIADTAIR